MRSNFYVTITGTTEKGEAVDQRFDGANGVLCFTTRHPPGDAPDVAKTLISGDFVRGDFAVLLRAVRKTIGPAEFARALRMSVFSRGIRRAD